jgi:hypothetical protein
MSRFEIDPTMSLLSLDGRSSLHAIHVETSGLTGWIQAALIPGTAQVKVSGGCLEIPLARLSSGNQFYDAELYRRINIRRHPTVTAVLSDWQPTANRDTYLVRGDVSFRGLTRSAEGEMALIREDDRTVVLGGSRVFDIRQFGMDPPRLLSVRVDPEVTIRVAIAARRPADT